MNSRPLPRMRSRALVTAVRRDGVFELTNRCLDIGRFQRDPALSLLCKFSLEATRGCDCRILVLPR